MKRRRFLGSALAVLCMAFALVLAGCDMISGLFGDDNGVITWTASPDSIINTTAIILSFSSFPQGLSLAHITISEGTGSVRRDWLGLTGSGTSRAFGVFIERAGTVYISINHPYFESGSQRVRVYL